MTTDIFPTEDNLASILYVIYQPIPHRKRVAMWVNGGQKKETIKFETFKRWIVSSDQENLIPSIMKTLMTYSFYLWDKKNAQAFYLQPNIHTNDFKKPLHQEIAEDFQEKQEKENEEKDPQKKIFDQFTMINLDDAKKKIGL
jgi:hypothetical protein